MIKKTIQGPTRVVFPTGQFISPGHQQFQCRRIDVHETWFCGVLAERTEEVVDFVEGYIVPQPHPLQGSYEHRLKNPGDRWCLHDHEFMVVADEDTDFWGGMTKAEWLTELKIRNIEGIHAGERAGWWTVDDEGNPRANGIRVSIAELHQENKTLMAHLMHDLGFFPSVGQARKNGWDKPLELGVHELGPKKKRITVEILP